MKELELDEFLALPGVVFDVRSPGEFAQGRIAGACNLPLFSNEERAEVGTCYKQVGKQEAVLLGLKHVGPKLATLLSQAKNQLAEGLAAKVHCWRGGMRSRSVALLLSIAGLPTVTLKGGYKSFRRWALTTLQQPRKLCLIGGLTGCGKTALLKELRTQGEQVLDLEALAQHRGSAFGSLNILQPSNEQFENEIALQWAHFDPAKVLFVEDESRLIGQCKIPDPLFAAMQQAELIAIDRPLNERLKILAQDYLCPDVEKFITITQQLSKRLGPQRTKEVIDALQSKNYLCACQSLLEYYDRCYQKSLAKRSAHRLYEQGLNEADWAAMIVAQVG